MTPDGTGSGKPANREAVGVQGDPDEVVAGSAHPTATGSHEQESVAPTKHGRRTGLGRGLAALIPSGQNEEAIQGARPLDVLFPGRSDDREVHARGGSARDLLVPGTQGKSKNRGSAHARQTPPRGRTSAKSLPDGVGVGNSGTPSGSATGEQSPATPRTGGKGRKAPESAAATRTGAGSVGPTEERSASPRTGLPGARGPELFDDLLTRAADVSRETSAPGPAGNLDVLGRDAQTGIDSGTEPDLVSVPGATFADIPTAWIIPNHRQPREVFDEDDLEELAASIREVGVLQPVVVRLIDTSGTPDAGLLELLEERPDARYELIMGERRLRASEIAGLPSVPAIVRHTDDADLLRDALLENLHRAQLNPLEEASAYQQLMADFGATQEELAKRIARSRPQIANTLRLLRLPPAVQRKVAAGVISAGHARALLSLGTPEEMDALADRIVSEGLSVRTTEELVRLGQTRRPANAPRRRAAALSPLGESLVSRLSDAYDTRVTITEGRTKGRIIIEFAGPDDLERLAELIVPGNSNKL